MSIIHYPRIPYYQSVAKSKIQYYLVTSSTVWYHTVAHNAIKYYSVTHSTLVSSKVPWCTLFVVIICVILGLEFFSPNFVLHQFVLPEMEKYLMCNVFIFLFLHTLRNVFISFVWHFLSPKFALYQSVLSEIETYIFCLVIFISLLLYILCRMYLYFPFLLFFLSKVSLGTSWYWFSFPNCFYCFEHFSNNIKVHIFKFLVKYPSNFIVLITWWFGINSRDIIVMLQGIKHYFFSLIELCIWLCNGDSHFANITI